MAKKKEKQIPAKQQMYEQIITKQLYGAQPSREEGVAHIQEDYNNWKQRQDGIAKLQSDYDNWLKAQQPAETPKVETPKVDTPKVEVPKVEAPKIEATVQKTPTQKSQTAAKKVIPEIKEEKKYLTHADMIPSLNKRSVDVTNYPEMAELERGGNVDLFNRPKVDTKELKKAGWQDAGDGTATVFSGTYTNAKGNKAANFTPIVTDKNGKYVRTLSEDELTDYAESVLDGRRKDDLKLQIGKSHSSIDDAVNAAERVHKLQEEYYLNPRKSKAENNAKSIAKIAKQLGITEDEVRQRMNAPKEELNAYDESKINKEQTEKMQAYAKEEKRKGAQKKQNVWDAFTGRMSKAMTDVVNAPVAIAGKIAGKDWSIYNDAQKEEFRNAKEQHPTASAIGDFAGMALAAATLGGGTSGMSPAGAKAGDVMSALRDEAILNGATKGQALMYGLKGAIPTLAANAASNMPTDFAVDVIPTLANDIAEGEKTDNEIIRDTILNTGINYGFNAIGDAISLGKAVKNAGNPVSGVDDVAKQIPGLNASENVPADEIARLNTNPLEADNKQFAELMNTYNSQFKDDSAMKNIFTPEDLDASQNRQLSTLMDEYRGDGLNDNFTKNSLDNVNNPVYDEGGRKVDAIFGGNKNGTEISTGYDGAGSEDLLRRTNENGLLGEGVRGVEPEGRRQLPSDRVLRTEQLIQNERVFSDEELNALKNNNIDTPNFYNTNNNPQLFFDALEDAKIKNSNGAAVDSHSIEDLQRIVNEGGNLHLVDNATSGYAVEGNGNLTGVFKNPENTTPFMGSKIALASTKNGAYKGDCFGRKLVNIYSRGGYEPVARMKYTPGYNPAMDKQVEEQIKKGLIKEAPDVYVLKLRDDFDYNKAVSEFNTAKQYSQAELDALPLYDDYDKMLEYRDSLIPMNLQHFAAQPNQGAFLNGANLVDDMVEGGQSRHIRGEGKMKMEGVSDEVIADFQDDPQLHSVLRNADTKAKAESIYNTSNNPEVDFRDMLRKHDPAALPLGHQLAKDYSAAGDHKAAAQIYREMGEQLTKAGQFSQAAAINMMKNDPLTALQYAERQIDTLNEQGLKRFGRKWTDFELTDAEKKLFDNIAPGDEGAIKAAYDQIGERLGKEYPTSFMDKLLEGRKIAMLFNVRTNVRNFGANIPTLGMRWAADRVEALGQNVAHLINPEFKVTQAVTGSGIQGRKLATEAFNSPRVQTMLEGTSGKYEIPDLKNSLVKNKQMYKGNRLEKWIDNATGGGIQKINEKLFGKKGVQSGLETIRNATYKMLDLGDSPFVKENFVERLGSYINAQKIKNLDDIPDEAIEIAWEEAMKATYKDESWAVRMLSGLKGALEKLPYGGRAASQAAIPFLQAPGNIAARMVDYSPLRGSKGIADIISGAHANDLKKVEKGIEEAAKGLTGTGMIYLGMKLREAGLITGTFSKDKDKKAFEKQNGFKEFALHIGNKYFTYDWAQPFAQELITGTLVQDAIEKSDEYDSDLLAYIDKKAGTNFNDSAASKALGVAGESAKASLNSWFNASPLQGVQKLLSGNYTDKEDIASSIKSTLVDDFAGAFIPSSVNAVAKSTDPVQRNTTDKTNSTATFVNQQIAKIPGLSKTLPAKYDTWGREMKYADNKAMATASRFVIPGDYSYDRNDATDKEINRLFESTGNNAVFPQVAPVKVGDKTLNNRETSRYQKEMGQRSRKLVDEFIKTKEYKKMSDEDKAGVIENLYKASKSMEDTAFGKEPSSTDKKIADLYKKEGAKGLVQEYVTKNALAQYDVNDSDGARAVYDDLGAKGLENYSKIKGKLNGSSSQENVKKAIDSIPSLSQSDKAKYYSYLEPKATPGNNPYGYVPGINYSPEDDKAYQTAKKEIPSLKPEKFYETKKSIDTDGNGNLKEAEVLSYINSNAKSYEEAQKMYNAYYGEHTNKKGQTKHIVKGKKGYSSSY